MREMIVAIYARKSTEQPGVPEEARSVPRQIQRAREYAERRGWIVAEEHVYADDGISGAEFARRPRLMALLGALNPAPAFGALVVMEQSRLGREQIETAWVLKQLRVAGVRVFSYLDDREIALDSPTDKLLASISAFADEMERHQASRRVKDAQLSKARAGYVAGGRRFGYTNVRVDGHVEKRVNPAEAPTVARIFELAAGGFGCQRIAATLHEEGHPTPRGAWWSASTVRDALRCELYRGVVVWNKTAKRDAWGRQHQRPRPADDWIRVERPELRIISDELWAAARARLEQSRVAYLRKSGQPAGAPINGIEARHLLIGLGACARCGGPLTARRQRYMCLGFVKGGPRACRNNMKLPLQAADEAVLSAIEDQVLRPEVVAAAIQEAVGKLRPREDYETERERLQSALTTLDGELKNLTKAVAEGGQLASLIAGIEERERRWEDLRRSLAALDARRGIGNLDHARLEKALRIKLADWQGLMARRVAEARQILRTLLVDRLQFALESQGYRFEGAGRLEPLVGNLATAAGSSGGPG